MDVSVLRTHKGRRMARLVGWAVIGFTGGILSVSNIFAEAYEPAELNELFKKYAAAYAAAQNIVNLTLISALGQ